MRIDGIVISGNILTDLVQAATATLASVIAGGGGGGTGFQGTPTRLGSVDFGGTDGFGIACNFSQELYTQVKIEKVA